MAQSRNFARTISSKYILETIIICVLCVIMLLDGGYKISFDPVQTSMILMLGLKSLPVIQTLNSTLINFKGNINAVQPILDRAASRDEARSTAESKLVIKKFESLQLQEITFSYSENDTLFSQFNLALTPGDKLLLNGKSGSGKSTLLNIMLGLIKPTSGKVTVNGIIDISQADLSGLIQYVPQHIFFENTTLENIFSKVDLNEHQLREHFKRLDLENIFDKFYKSKIGDNGDKLSGGERQRVALIRAALSTHEVLFLDEATSALNVALETRALEYAFEQSSTIVCVSHSSQVSDLFNRIGGTVID